MSKTYQTTVRLAGDQGEALEAEAAGTERRVSEVIREILAAHLAAKPCRRCAGSGKEPS